MCIASKWLLIAPGYGTAADENYEKWPVLMERAVRSAEDADPRPRNRAFVLAVTRSMQDPPLDGIAPTSPLASTTTDSDHRPLVFRDA